MWFLANLANQNRPPQLNRHRTRRQHRGPCPLWSSRAELAVSLTQASPMSLCGALDITRRRYGVYHLHGLCHGYNRRWMVNACCRFTEFCRGLQRPSVRPSDPGTPFSGLLLEYVNAERLVLHHPPSCSQAGRKGRQCLAAKTTKVLFITVGFDPT
jgi:hypothetical protein